jgi:hypothetical protein
MRRFCACLFAAALLAACGRSPTLSAPAHASRSSGGSGINYLGSGNAAADTTGRSGLNYLGSGN